MPLSCLLNSTSTLPLLSALNLYPPYSDYSPPAPVTAGPTPARKAISWTPGFIIRRRSNDGAPAANDVARGTDAIHRANDRYLASLGPPEVEEARLQVETQAI